MQLDSTHVAIRQRSVGEIGDLALMVLRKYPQAILIGFALGALPFFLINALLLSWLPLSETAENFFDEETVASRIRYVWLMSVLVFLEAPLAGVFTTTYIGQAIFEQQPTWYSVFRDTLKLTPRLLLTLGFVRGPLIAMVLILLIRNEPFSLGIEFFGLSLLLLFAMGTRGLRPFLPEILLLERCPLVAQDKDSISIGRRSSLLHAPISGDLIGRFMITGFVTVLVGLSLFYGYSFLSTILFNSSSWSLWISMIVLPLALWSAAAFSVIFRFLSYLDSRIRLEGWEVELLLRAEASRQFGEQREGVETK